MQITVTYPNHMLCICVNKQLFKCEVLERKWFFTVGRLVGRWCARASRTNSYRSACACPERRFPFHLKGRTAAKQKKPELGPGSKIENRELQTINICCLRARACVHNWLWCIRILGAYIIRRERKNMHIIFVRRVCELPRSGNRHKLACTW